jgi:hypothetical protein
LSDQSLNQLIALDDVVNVGLRLAQCGFAEIFESVVLLAIEALITNPDQLLPGSLEGVQSCLNILNYFYFQAFVVTPLVF